MNLQYYAKKQASYLKNSLALKSILEDLPPLLDHAMLFTSDATSMYTNIDTNHALHVIGRLIHKIDGKPNIALMAALRLIMTNNIMQLGDTFWLQLLGTAMGTPPACAYATLYYACHEEFILEKYNECLLFY
jgi:hypothetical protein